MDLISLDPTESEFPDKTKIFIEKVYVLITEACGINVKM